MELFSITKPKGPQVPIIISSPHSGTYFPDEVAAQLTPEAITHPDDTDWFIHQLYDFAPAMGITLIAANYNRWVIDLNRDPDSVPLYSDGRVITGLVPTTNFNGESLYRDVEPDSQEIERRKQAYYQPYHEQLHSLLQEVKRVYGKALLFDAHSIRKQVPGIRPEPFPDLILGDNDGKAAAKHIIDVAYNSLQQSDYDLQHNHPFKGGYITRSCGDPEKNIHALQLEMAKTNYMDDTETQYDPQRAGRIRELLQQLFYNLINEL